MDGERWCYFVQKHVSGTQRKGEALLSYVRDNVVGNDSVFEGPFGPRPVTYCDYTASGKPLKFIEDYLNSHIYPFYGNTHTTTSIVSRQTSELRNEARDIIKKCLKANEDDVVIFTGSGTTGAIHKLLNALQLNQPQYNESNTVVFTSPFEHHSNILPWKEAGLKVVRIRETNEGLVDTSHLLKNLKKYKSKNYFMMAAFSAASNVTGIMTDTVEVATLLHQYGALSFWDYASGAPYLSMDMNATGKGYKDAIFCSPHKFVGGPQTPGLLIAKKWLFRNQIPHGCGGGTVLFVTREKHVYLDNIEEREEGGTPAIIESIRAGLVFQMKDAIGTELIEKKEHELCRRAFSAWEDNPNILVLGSKTAERLPIFSLLIMHPESGKFLHHNFISVILNDLYGIQSRGGCACAGPYAQDLLQMDEVMAQKFIWFLKGHTKEDGTIVGPQEIMKPGFARLNLPYFFDDETINFIIDAVDRVARDGWKLLPLYQFDNRTGGWQHRSFRFKLTSLHDIRYSTHGMKIRTRRDSIGMDSSSLKDIAKQADEIFKNASSLCKGINCTQDPEVELSMSQRKLVWFLQPKDAQQYLSGQMTQTLSRRESLPFYPRSYSLDDLTKVDEGVGLSSSDECLSSDSGAQSGSSDEVFPQKKKEENTYRIMKHKVSSKPRLNRMLSRSQDSMLDPKLHLDGEHIHRLPHQNATGHRFQPKQYYTGQMSTLKYLPRYTAAMSLYRSSESVDGADNQYMPPLVPLAQSNKHARPLPAKLVANKDKGPYRPLHQKINVHLPPISGSQDTKYEPHHPKEKKKGFFARKFGKVKN